MLGAEMECCINYNACDLYVRRLGVASFDVCSVLAEFQSRKAHRVQIRDKDLFKYLCCMLVVVIGYMSAWTAVTLDHTGSRGSILQTGVTVDNLVYVVCQSKWWDYVIETGSSRFSFSLSHL